MFYYAAETKQERKAKASCSTAPLQPRGPTPLLHRGRGIEVAKCGFRLTSLQLRLKSNLSTKVLARLTRINKQGSCKRDQKKL